MERRLVSKDYSFHIVGGYIGRRRQDASFTNVTKQYQNMDVDFIGSGGNNQGKSHSILQGTHFHFSNIALLETELNQDCSQSHFRIRFQISLRGSNPKARP